MRILVVEDDLIQQQVLACFLQSRNYYVETAGTGQEAIRKMQQGSFDLAFIDYLMPGFDGLIAATVVRNNRAGIRAIPTLIALSSSLDIVVEQEAGSASVFDRLIQKPWDADTILGIVEEHRIQSKSRAIVQTIKPAAAVANVLAAAPVRMRDSADEASVLLIEEDEQVAASLKQSLEAAGYAVSVAVDRDEAVRVIGAHRYDVVLADYLKSSRFCGHPDLYLSGASVSVATN